MTPGGVTPAYARVQGLIAEDRCVVLDGGISTELQHAALPGFEISDKRLWGTEALYHAPHAVLGVHQRYIAAGCDIVSTNTWGILKAPELEGLWGAGSGIGRSHWMDMARLGIRLARQAVDEAGKTDELAVAFTINGDVDSPERQDTLHLLTRVFQDQPPDFVLIETLSLVREELFQAVEIVLDTGIPVWLSFRRCRHGVCGVYGQHWGGPEGDLFGRAARRFEGIGVGALLINCLPVDHVPGMLPWLRDFTDLPLGVYPNLGRYLDPGWMFDERVEPADYAQLALQWREEGAQIIGGCCGVTPEHIAAASQALEGTQAGHRRGNIQAVETLTSRPPEVGPGAGVRASAGWPDALGRDLYPLPFPKITVDPEVFLPTQGSFLVWKFLFTSGTGQGKACLDVGCGTGVLAIQMALNGASSVRAIDVQSAAVANALSNAFRNGVADRVKGEVVDLYNLMPAERYDVIVASLFQMPVDPLGEMSGHRPMDFWGRNMVDHLIRLLPDLLAEGGVAYLMQISILGQQRTSEMLEAAGLESRVIDFSFFSFSPVFHENMEQIRRVEQLSDAYHLVLGQDVMVMYLLEIKRREK